MKRISAFLLLGLCLLPAILLAQSKADDAIYLNNGSIMRGRVIESVPGKGVTIEIVGNNVLVIPENEIQKVVLREPQLKETPTDHPVKTGKLEIYPQLHLFGGTDQTWGFTLQTGYILPYGITAAAGTGVEWFRTSMLPVFGQLSWKILPASVSPYLYAQAGYSFSLEKGNAYTYYYYPSSSTEYGGILAGGGIGIRSDFTKRSSITFSLGYRYQKSRLTSTSDPYWGGSEVKTERIDHFNRLALSIGFMFR